MRLRYIIFMAMLVFTAKASFAQTAPYGYWTKVKMPVDSAYPYQISFADSLVGYAHFRAYNYPFTPHVRAISYPHVVYISWYYRTSDGGITWTPINFGSKFANIFDSATRAYMWHDDFNYTTDFVIIPASHNIAYLKAEVTDSTQHNYTRYVQLITTDAGKTWNTSLPGLPAKTTNWRLRNFQTSNYGLATVVGGGSSHLYYTADAGKNWFQREGQNEKHVFGEQFDWFDINNLLVVDSDAYHNELVLFGSQTAGTTWNEYRWKYPTEWKWPWWFGKNPSWFPRTLQCLHNTSHAFIFSGLESNIGIDSYSTSSDTMATFLHSSDYGKTWTPNSSFIMRCKGFEATAPNDIWMTVISKEYTYHYLTLTDSTFARVANEKPSLASWIVHSTDTGATWYIDKSTLTDHESEEYDGEIIASSDPEHVWIAALQGHRTYIYKYHAPAKSSVVEDDGNGTPKNPPIVSNFPNPYNLYPNPADKKMKLAIWRGVPILDVSVCDILGRTYDVPVQRIANSMVELDVSLLKAGSYLVRFSEPTGPHGKLFLVQHP